MRNRYSVLSLAISMAFTAACGVDDSSTSAALTRSGSTARIVDPRFAVHSVVIAVKDVVVDYKADSSGVRDASGLFQTAIDDVAAAGGGTLWVPAGSYRLDHKIRLHDGVLLHGDWKQPTAGNHSVVGQTILAIYQTQDPAVVMTSNTGLDGLVFWYPNQSLTSPDGTAVKFDRGDKKSASSITIMNITLINPAKGIVTGGDEEDLIANILITGVYGAALDTALYLSKTVGGGTQTETHLGARYWSDSGLPAPSYAVVAAYTKAHATGIKYLDNWRSFNVTIDDFATGIRFEGRPVDDSVEGQRMVGLEIRGAQRAIEIAAGNNFFVNNGSLEGSLNAILVRQGLGSGSVLLDEVAVSSGGVAIDDQSPEFTVNVMSTTFSAWKDYAIRATGADLIVAGSSFTQAHSGDKDLFLGSQVSHAIVMSNTFADQFTYDSEPSALRKLYVNNAKLALAGGITGFASTGLGTQIAVPAQPKPLHTGTHSLFDVTSTDFAGGAVADCTSDDFDIDTGKMTGDCTDSQPAFQAALDAARVAQGGTVYVPGSTFAVQTKDGTTKYGAYYLSKGLVVPHGVELTTADGDRLVNMTDTRTMLVVEGDSSPFISLDDHAGLRGVTIWYANQDGYAPRPFGPAVQARGAGDWLVSLNVPNATYGADFATIGSESHYISKMRTEAYTNALSISKSTSGIVLDFGEKGGGGYDDGIIDFPTRKGTVNGQVVVVNPPSDAFNESGDAIKDGYADTAVGQIADCYKSGVGVLLGAARNEMILDAYIHSPHVGLKAAADGGLGGPTFTLIAYGSETFTGMEIDALALPPLAGQPSATIVSAQWHTIAMDGYPGRGPDIAGEPYLVVGEGVPANARIAFFTLMNHSYTPIGFDLRGGDTIVQQIYSDLVGNDAGPVKTAVRVRGAKTGFAAIGGKFIDPLDGSVISNGVGDPAQSPNVALAGVSLASHVQTQGPVDLSFQPPW